jgi:hypothetical protein
MLVVPVDAGDELHPEALTTVTLAIASRMPHLATRCLTKTTFCSLKFPAWAESSLSNLISE